MKFLSVFAFGILVAGCSGEVPIEVVDTSVSGNPSVFRVIFKAGNEVDKSRMTGQLTARLYICGAQQFENRSNVALLEGGASEYVAEFPGALEDRAHFESSGLVSRGWPTALVDERGVCFRAGIGDLRGRILETREVRIESPSDMRAR